MSTALLPCQVVSPFSVSSSPSKAYCIWTVENIINKNGFIWSHAFYFTGNDQVKMYLNLQPTTKMKYGIFGGAKFFTLCLYVPSSDKLPVHIRMAVLDGRTQKCNEQAYQVTFARSMPKYQRFQAHYLIERDYLLKDSGLVINGKVTFYCEVEKIPEIEVKDAFSGHDEALCLKTSQDYEAFLAAGKSTDVILKVGGQELKAHKNFLSARSPIFAAMFDHECKENQENIVEITDVPLDVFEELLRYIYSGKTPALQQFAPELLSAADKYQLMSLKFVCARYMASKLTVDTVAETLRLADLHQESQLKKQCIDYINNRAVEVMATDGWQNLMGAKQIELLAELYKALSIKGTN